MAAKTRAWAFPGRLAPDPAHTPGAVAAVLQRAVAELRRASRGDPARAADGAVLLIERMGPAIEVVEDVVGTLAGAAARAIDRVAPMIAGAPAEDAAREAWLQRLWAALVADEAGHVRRLAEHWGALCATPARAGEWAARLLPAAREGLATAASIACLAGQVASGQHAAALGLLAGRQIEVWPERQFGVLALAAGGDVAAALTYARASNPLGHRHAQDIARVCESVLRAAGREAEAYAEFAFTAHARQNCRQTFEAVRAAYPAVAASKLLGDLLAASPGQEGRWFATACALRFWGLAAEIAAQSPCDPRTLLRIGLGRLEADPEFAREAAVAALRWTCGGHGVEITGDDVYAAFDLARVAGLRTDALPRTRSRIAAACDQPHPAAQWVLGLLAAELG